MARSRADLKPVDQLAMDEKVVEDDVLEQALEKRTRAQDDIAEIRPILKNANEIIRDRASFHDVKPGEPIRVGRFRVSRTIVAGGSPVSFTTAERSQVNVKIVERSDPVELATLNAPSRGAARQAFLEYREAVLASLDAEASYSIDVAKRDALERRRVADEAIMAGYRQLALGRQVIDVRQTVASGGLDSAGRPKIALARADLERVAVQVTNEGALWFDRPERMNRQRSAARIHLPDRTVPANQLRELSENIRRTFGGWRFQEAIVPSIPPRFRPTASLERFWLLFEAEYLAPPVDPALVRPIGSGLAVVVAVWDLTPLERAVLGMERAS